MKFSLSDTGDLRKPKTERSKYSIGRSAALFVLVLLSFYAVTTFPGYYSDGIPSPNQWGTIIIVMLAGVTALRFERSCSSKMGKRPHDWNSSGGTLHAFSFVRVTCGKCGKRLVLACKSGKTLRYVTPGLAVPDGAKLSLLCPECGELHPYTELEPKQFREARATGELLKKAAEEARRLKAYKLDRSYPKKYLTVSIILMCAEISCFYISRLGAVRLILPFCVGYLLAVALSNLFTAYTTRYYVSDLGVIQRIPWGYSVYPLNERASLVRFSDKDGASWGFYTDSENLLISPVIAESGRLLEELKEKCRLNNIPVIM